MTCRFTYQGKVYNQDSLVKALQNMPPEHAQKYVPNLNHLPDMPFKQTEQWAGLALKRMIQKAVEENKSRISWTPGEAQAARYDLSKQLDRIVWEPDHGRLIAYDKNGREVIGKTNVAEKDLPDVIGKEAADKIVNSPSIKNTGQVFGEDRLRHILENADLKVGGEGMKGFYDQMLPKIVEKLGKQYGVKVKEGNLSGTVKEYPKTNEWGAVLNGREHYFKSKEEAENAVGNKVHYFDIPPKMKEDILKKGFPLFSDSTVGGPLSAQEQTNNNKKQIERPIEEGKTEPKINVPGRAAGGRVLASNIDANPSEAQKHAGNYKKDHINLWGLNITIENAKNSIRRGVGPDGKAWAAKLPCAYGYICTPRKK